jgi:Rps23 Pro-64 3,4-dihydroxylase Tpa1-like proline 4-hydroxylase
MELSRSTIGREISSRLRSEAVRLKQQWHASGPINHFVIDDVLPAQWTAQIASAFPDSSTMTLRSSLRERKFIAAQMSKYAGILEEAIYAFQVPEVIEIVQQITQLRALEPDELLYAGGISLMARGHFLNPHLDNSHDKLRKRYRVLNLLYYVSPDWQLENGGNLELWPRGSRGEPQTIVSKTNRLAVMVTHDGSWHSVSPNVSAANRCCVSNYYFSSFPAGDHDYFQVTTFRGRPDQPIRSAVLAADGLLRRCVRSIFPAGVKESGHYYKR